MLRYEFDENFRERFKENWNTQIHSMRVTCFVIGILMAVLGVVCLIFPVQSVFVVEVIASLAIMIFGIFEIIEYIRMPFAYLLSGVLMSGILNIIVGIMLLTSPKEAMLTAFSFIIAIDLMIMGIQELSFSSVLRFMELESYGWVIAMGIVNICLSVLFFCMPMASSAALGVIAAIYLLAGGITLIVETVKLKDRKIV